MMQMSKKSWCIIYQKANNMYNVLNISKILNLLYDFNNHDNHL